MRANVFSVRIEENLGPRKRGPIFIFLPDPRPSGACEQNLPNSPRARAHGGAHKTSELAAKTIERLADKSRPASEHARAKRRLIHGPKEFRDIRADQPKRRGNRSAPRALTDAKS